jgi:hypothetical protein
VAKKFGKRAKPGAGDPAEDPRDLFGAPQLPRHTARPASSTPLADQLNRGWPGVDPGYVVLPRSIAESMSLPWQQQMAALLAQFHQQHSRLAWPIYRVVPSRYEKLVDLDEEQLAEAGYLVEIDTEGEMVYRERSGRKIEEPRNTTVLVSCLDPIPRPAGSPAPQPAPAAREDPSPPAGPPPARAPAPMNIGPAPVWRTVTPPPTPPPPPVPVPPAQKTPAPPPGPPPPPVPVPPEELLPAEPTPDGSQVDTPPRGFPLPQPNPRRPGPGASGPGAPGPNGPGPGGPGPNAPVPYSQGPSSPADRGWFDALAEQRAESAKTEKPPPDEFGPTGDPTEIPYRYRP